MLLIGQYDSPFVRRVGIALTLYQLPFRQAPLSVFRDAGEIALHNPLRRVPTLVLEDGTALGDSAAILDTLDDMVGPARALFPTTGVARRDAVRCAALACGVSEKAVSLFYEQRLHDQTSALWEERCARQIGDALAALEADWAARSGDWWHGDAIGHADIATACAWRFAREAHPGLIAAELHPALASLSARCEALPAFRAIEQTFSPPVQSR